MEIYYSGRWGTVCDDGWRTENAVVVCRQLGYSGVVDPDTYFAAPNLRAPIHMDNVLCTGAESRLEDCKFNGWGIHNCAHREDVGVTCQTGRLYVCLSLL